MTDLALLARIDQHRAHADALVDFAVDRLRKLLATEDDPGLVAVRLAISLHRHMDMPNLADLLAFALLRLAEQDGAPT